MTHGFAIQYCDHTTGDPVSKYDDAQLWDALRRSYLVETRPSTPRETYPEASEPSGENRHQLTLDSAIETDGQNLSVGERSLLSLARALVQRLARGHPRRGDCVACTVLDAGKIAEFDTTLKLFNRNESLFRSLCDKSNIASGDIEKAYISDDVE
ncbi:hypothetical protein B0H13DRAFT_2349460 [Mycena leptocephala]|nr:hypothetical protein B0H13DRAFT_2349460 [Mycena leptocephala]